MRHMVLVGIAFVVAGCVQLGHPFVHIKPDYTALPADALREVAREIEHAVQEEVREPEIANREGVVVQSDTITQAIRMRAARAALLNQLLNSGHALEARNGLVAILTSKEYKKSTTPLERDRNALLVMNENNARWAIYEGIIEESNITPKALSAVQEIFHEARRECMPAGQKYEDASGQTVLKGR